MLSILGRMFTWQISKIHLTLEGSFPCWRVGVFEICHVNIRPRIESINHHFSIYGACDLHTALAKVGWNRPDLPIGIPNLKSLVEKIGECSGSKVLMNKDSLSH